MKSISNNIAVLSTASVFITECHGLKRLMGLVLQLSNYLNHGTYRSGAFGFKIGSKSIAYAVCWVFPEYPLTRAEPSL